MRSRCRAGCVGVVVVVSQVCNGVIVVYCCTRSDYYCNWSNAVVINDTASAQQISIYTGCGYKGVRWLLEVAGLLCGSMIVWNEGVVGVCGGGWELEFGWIMQSLKGLLEKI